MLPSPSAIPRAPTRSKTASLNRTFHFTTQMKAVPSRGWVRYRGEQPALKGRRLLIVDDTNRRILTLQAESWGMQARAVASGREALALIERGDLFDVGILDMQMPELAALCQAMELNDGRVSAKHIEQLKTMSSNAEVRIEIDRLSAAGSNGVD